VGIIKLFFKDKKSCRVTFNLSRETSGNAERAFLAGEFNNWDKKTSPMEKDENGSFSLSMVLNTGRKYKFLYLVDDNRWLNDEAADEYVSAPYGSRISVVSL
jgi:1,4-alpha-glucan branching enzyme